MSLFQDERIITSSKNDTLILTNKRIRKQENRGSSKYLGSIHLEKISSIEMAFTAYWLILVAGIISFLIGAAQLFVDFGGSYNSPEMMLSALVIGGILLALYFGTRKHVITISSDGGAKIVVETKGMKSEDVLDFIHKIEWAKHEVSQT